MKLRKLLLAVCILAVSSAAFAQSSAKDMGYVIVTKYLKADGKKDVSDAIQKVIDTHPNRTIYFPDGVYLISKPILTPADPEKSVALELSNYAVIRAAGDWSSDEAMIRLGAKDPANNVRIPGSNYYLNGGIIDGSGVAKGISIDGGRETAVRNTSIKNVSIGLHIKYGANSGSSDCDINNVNIVCNRTPESIGVWVQGYDNTFTNIRIGGVHVGVKLQSGGNYLRNIHPLYYNARENYETSYGFISENPDNWFDFCYSDQFATGFCNSGNSNIYHNCFVYWYSAQGDKHTAFKTTGRFNANVMNLTVGMGTHNAVKENVILEAAEDGGYGQFQNLNVSNPAVLTDHTHDRYLR